MAVREPTRYLAKALPRALVPVSRPQWPALRRNASDQAAAGSSPDPLDELETSSSLAATVPEEVVKSYDPIARARSRKTELPPSR